MTRVDWRLLGVAMAIVGLSGFSVVDPRIVPDEAPVPEAVPHITLDASAPEDDSSVEGEVNEVRLFFSEPPLMRGASIRIVDSSRKLVRSTPPEADPEDPSQLSVQIAQGLPAGRYVVQWRCIADDGHVMRGSFTFDVVGR